MENKEHGESVSIQEMQPPEILSIVHAQHGDPFSYLGPHWIQEEGSRSLAIRTLRPGARQVSILWTGGGTTEVSLIHTEGLFEAVIPSENLQLPVGEPVNPAAYRLRYVFADGNTFETHDPYAFPPVLTDYDLYLAGEGSDYLKYEKLGAHVREVAGIRGVQFGVWAPNAKRVSCRRS